MLWPIRMVEWRNIYERRPSCEQSQPVAVAAVSEWQSILGSQRTLYSGSRSEKLAQYLYNSLLGLQGKGTRFSFAYIEENALTQ